MYAVFQTATRRGGAKFRSRAIAVIGGAMILAATMPTVYAQIGKFDAAASPLARFAFTGTFRYQLPKTVISTNLFKSRRLQASRIEPQAAAIVANVVPVKPSPSKSEKIKPAGKKVGPARQTNPTNAASSSASARATVVAPIDPARTPPNVGRKPPPTKSTVKLNSSTRQVARVLHDGNHPVKTENLLVAKNGTSDSPKTPKPNVQAKSVNRPNTVATTSKRPIAQPPSQPPSLSRQTRSALGALVPHSAKIDQAPETTAERGKPITIAKVPDRPAHRSPIKDAVKALDTAVIEAPVKPRTIVAAAPLTPDTVSQDSPKPSITRSVDANLPPLPIAYQKPKPSLSAGRRSTRADSKTRSRISNRSRRKKNKAANAKKAKISKGEPLWMRNVLRN